MNAPAADVSESDALIIARQHWLQAAERAFDEGARNGSVKVVDREKCRVCVYLATTDPTWVVYAPRYGDRGRGTLDSSHVIIISKNDGQVVYDGPANDEG